MDCSMPEMDGNETTEMIRAYLYEQSIEQPIVSAVTGHQEQIHINHAINSGMNQVLSKPVNIGCVKDIIERLRYPIKGSKKALRRVTSKLLL